MGTPFMSELRIMSFNFAPKGWAQCNGQLLPINQNQALFSLLGTTFGGNGQTTFALPDLRGRLPIHQGQGWIIGQNAGEESHTLIQPEMPAHNHVMQAVTGTGNVIIPVNGMLATTPAKIYDAPNNLTTLNPASVSDVGGSQPHENRQPYLVLNICIALQGVFPSRN